MKKFFTLLMAMVISFGLSTCAFRESVPEPNYIHIMTEAAVAGDIKAGRSAAENRNRYIAESGSDLVPISFDDLFLLSKFICFQAGKHWLTDEFLLCVGEVVMNRVKSPEFPNTIEEVIYESGQYDGVQSEDFQKLLPSEKCVNAAIRLLNGERMMESYVVFQSDIRLGNVYSAFGDRVMGFTYFCESPNLELYRDSEPSSPGSIPTAEDSPKASFSSDAFRDFKDSSIIVYSESEYP